MKRGAVGGGGRLFCSDYGQTNCQHSEVECHVKEGGSGGYKGFSGEHGGIGVSDETVRYGREFCGTSAQVRLLWQGPEAIRQ
jgi:hypothetical protein